MGRTLAEYEQRVVVWREMVFRAAFRPENYGAPGRDLIRELDKLGYIDRTPSGWRIARNTPGMPEEVDPAHWWQVGAWTGLRWFPAGISPEELHAIVAPSLGVSERALRDWLRLCVDAGVVGRRRLASDGRRIGYRSLLLHRNEPPHRADLLRRARDGRRQAEAQA